MPIFISQLRALYPNKENEDKYTELVRGYLDFDVDMENIGVFWSGAEALILDYSRDQQKLRDKQKMLKSDWEKRVSRLYFVVIVQTSMSFVLLQVQIST